MQELEGASSDAILRLLVPVAHESVAVPESLQASTWFETNRLPLSRLMSKLIHTLEDGEAAKLQPDVKDTPEHMARMLQLESEVLSVIRDDSGLGPILFTLTVGSGEIKKTWRQVTDGVITDALNIDFALKSQKTEIPAFLKSAAPEVIDIVTKELDLLKSYLNMLDALRDKKPDALKTEMTKILAGKSGRSLVSLPIQLDHPMAIVPAIVTQMGITQDTLKMMVELVQEGADPCYREILEWAAKDKTTWPSIQLKRYLTATVMRTGPEKLLEAITAFEDSETISLLRLLKDNDTMASILDAMPNDITRMRLFFAAAKNLNTADADMLETAGSALISSYLATETGFVAWHDVSAFTQSDGKFWAIIDGKKSELKLSEEDYKDLTKTLRLSREWLGLDSTNSTLRVAHLAVIDGNKKVPQFVMRDCNKDIVIKSDADEIASAKAALRFNKEFKEIHGGVMVNDKIIVGVDKTYEQPIYDFRNGKAKYRTNMDCGLQGYRDHMERLGWFYTNEYTHLNKNAILGISLKETGGFFTKHTEVKVATQTNVEAFNASWNKAYPFTEQFSGFLNVDFTHVDSNSILKAKQQMLFAMTFDSDGKQLQDLQIVGLWQERTLRNLTDKNAHSQYAKDWIKAINSIAVNPHQTVIVQIDTAERKLNFFNPISALKFTLKDGVHDFQKIYAAFDNDGRYFKTEDGKSYIRADAIPAVDIVDGKTVLNVGKNPLSLQLTDAARDRLMHNLDAGRKTALVGSVVEHLPAAVQARIFGEGLFKDMFTTRMHSGGTTNGAKAFVAAKIAGRRALTP